MYFVWILLEGLVGVCVGGVFLRVMRLCVALASVQGSGRLGVREVRVLAKCNTLAVADNILMFTSTTPLITQYHAR